MKIEKKFIIVIIIVMILNMIFNIKYCYAEIPIEDWMSSEMKEEIRKRNEQERKERYERNKKYQEEAGRVFNSDIVNYEPTKEDIPEEINKKVGRVLGVIQIVGMTVAVLALMIIGIRAMTGSVEEKAEYKKSLPGYVIGAILVAAIGWLPTIIYNMVNGI